MNNVRYETGLPSRRKKKVEHASGYRLGPPVCVEVQRFPRTPLSDPNEHGTRSVSYKRFFLIQQRSMFAIEFRTLAPDVQPRTAITRRIRFARVKHAAVYHCRSCNQITLLRASCMPFKSGRVRVSRNENYRL